MTAYSLVRTIFAAALFAGFGGSALAQTNSEGDTLDTTKATAGEKLAVVSAAIDAAIVPGYRAFAKAARAETSAIAALCKTPSPDALGSVRNGFSDLVEAWSAVEFVKFGPVMEDNRADRILFFPDRRSLGLRQVQSLIAKPDDSIASGEALAHKSVAVQGLGALELVLYGDGAEALGGTNGIDRCGFARAITENLSTMADRIVTGWTAQDGIVEHLTVPKAGDPAYRSADDSLKEIVEIFIHGFEAMRDLRLTPAMGEDEKNARPKLFLFHRSNRTLASLRANYAGLSKLFETSKVTALLPESQAYLKNAIRFEFENADRTLAAMEPPLSDLATSSEDRQALTYLLIVTNSLQKQFAGQLSPALGLSAGFSSLDGD